LSPSPDPSTSTDRGAGALRSIRLEAFMNRTLLVAAIAVAAVSFAPAAGAQDTVSRAGVVPRTASYASLMAAVAATGAAADKISARTTLTVEDVTIANIADYIDDMRKDEFEAGVDRQKESLPTLHEALNKVGAVRDALAAHALKPEISDVVAVDVADAGEVIIYIKK
jgi:hypothetical protein